MDAVSIADAIAELAPDNEHPIPVAISLEREVDEDGNDICVWWAFLDVRSPTQGEWGTEARALSLSKALGSALSQLKRLMFTPV